MKKEIVFKRLAEDAKFWRDQFNQAMDELEKFDNKKRFRCADETIEEIIHKAHKIIE